MGLVIVKRPPRRPAPAVPTGEVVLDPPPELPGAAGKGWGRMLSLMPMAAGTAAMGLMMGTQRGGPMAYVAGGSLYWKNLRTGGPTNLSVRMEVLNLFNQVQWAAPASTAFGNSSFGQITNQANNMRMVQLTFRFQF